MIEPEEFLAALERCDIRFVAGVPDSLLKEACKTISAVLPPDRHVIAANEGGAVGMAIGHYLGTGRPALVYMQNSGLGNAVNPLASLVHPGVLGIPMLLMVGWRGEIDDDQNQRADEPQHGLQGRITERQLSLLEVPYEIVDDTAEIAEVMDRLVQEAMRRSGACAMLVRKGSFAPSSRGDSSEDAEELSREDALSALLEGIPEEWPMVVTTGMASREIAELRASRGESTVRDLLTVGGMGHASQIALGVARARPDLKVVCVDGDGALIMHMGGSALTARQSNLVHIVINNEAHDSVGGQPTPAKGLSLTDCARSAGYHLVGSARTELEIQDWIRGTATAQGSAFLEVRCRRGARKDLGRPSQSPAENKRGFMTLLGVDPFPA